MTRCEPVPIIDSVIRSNHIEMGASLAQLVLSSRDPQALSAFYASTFQLRPIRDGEAMHCSASGRELVIVPGEPGQLCRAFFRFGDVSRFEAQRLALQVRGVKTIEQATDRFTACDPEGRLVTFMVGPGKQAAGAEPLTARLQHFGVRTPAPEPLLDFYVEKLGFVLSDRVLDEEGKLTAGFLRTDSEHHSMAIFRASTLRFDHFSCEATNWEHLRDWADHMAAVGVDLAWGIGRHGPGSDTFLMVRDPDGNLAEVSSDLELCAPDRLAGVWPHRPQTLNQWGLALMRT